MIPKSTTTIAPGASTNMFPGCMSAWKKPSRNTWLKKAAGRLGQHVVDPVPGGEQPCPVVDPHALDPFERQHAAAGARPVDARHAKTGIAGEIFRKLRGGRGLEAQIHLETHDFSQGADDLDRLQPAQRRMHPFEQHRKPHKQLEVAGEGVGDTRAQHLDRDLLAGGGAGEMDLRDRGGGNRGFVEGLEQGVERLGEFGLDRGPRRRTRKGRQPVLQAGEIGGDLVTQQIGARRQHLAELDKARAELVEGGGKALAGARRRPAPPSREQPGDPQVKRHDRHRGERKQRVVPR